MIKAIIIDDEPGVRENLRERLEEHFKNDIIVVAEADGLESGLAAIAAHQPNILLLDINLAPGTGFDLITQSTYKDFELIFVTAYDQHAIEAIKVGALDYILKPVDGEEFNAAIEKAMKNYQQEKYLEKHLEKLVEISGEYFRGTQKKRVILRTTETVHAVYEEDILYCKSEGNYTTFHTRQMEKIVISKSMKTAQEILSEDIFVRCHQSYVVNKQHVLKYDKKGVLIMHLGTEVPVSGRRKEYTLERVFN